GVLLPTAQPAPTTQPLPQPPAVQEIAPAQATPLITLTNVQDPQASTGSELIVVDTWLPLIAKVVSFFLTIQSLYGIYKSLHFLFVEYQLLEQQLVQHVLTQPEINAIASKAVLTMISTIISIFFALKLAVLKAGTAKKLSIGIGVFMFF